jgi:hypothetical protein
MHVSIISPMRTRSSYEESDTTYIRVKNDILRQHSIDMRPKISKHEPRHGKVHAYAISNAQFQRRREGAGGSESDDLAGHVGAGGDVRGETGGEG